MAFGYYELELVRYINNDLIELDGEFSDLGVWVFSGGATWYQGQAIGLWQEVKLGGIIFDQLNGNQDLGIDSQENVLEKVLMYQSQL